MMKKKFINIFGLICLGSTTLFAQNDISRSENLLIVRKTTIKSSEVSGSPYYQENFEKATVNGGTQLFLIRYNAYADVMEYENNGEVLELIKDKNTEIRFVNGDVFKLKSYNNQNDNPELGYLKEIANYGDWTFFEQLRKYIYKGRSNNNGYQTSSSSDRYENDHTEYYIANKDAIYYVKKLKKLPSIFPEKGDQIKKYLKENRVNLNDKKSVQRLLESISKM